MARNLGTQDVSWFLDMYGKKQLDLDPPYQRRSVWSPRDKRFFIDTILNNYPAPPIFLHKTLDDNGRPTYHVVDGKQRLQTIIDFSEGRLRIPDDFADVNLQKKRWKDIERGTRERFWNYVLVVEMLPDVSDAAVRNIFDRINRNARKLMPQEMRHAKYDGWFIATAEAESEKAEWRHFGVVTPARVKRMADVQFISELLMLQIKGQIIGFDQDVLDEFYAEYEDTSEIGDFVEDDFTQNLETTKQYLAEMLASTPACRVFMRVQSHFYTLWSYLTLESARRPNAAEFAPLYHTFLTHVTNYMEHPDNPPNTGNADYDTAVVDYAADTRGASTDITPRLNRHKALVVAIHGVQAVDE
ncbi:MAG: DUF262 domain-containing protein [Mesorhizobium sp.]|nr:MAG: DUF262 domain-containing protein [Mesorhizobium sp.]